MDYSLKLFFLLIIFFNILSVNFPQNAERSVSAIVPELQGRPHSEMRTGRPWFHSYWLQWFCSWTHDVLVLRWWYGLLIKKMNSSRWKVRFRFVCCTVYIALFDFCFPVFPAQCNAMSTQHGWMRCIGLHFRCTDFFQVINEKENRNYFSLWPSWVRIW